VIARSLEALLQAAGYQAWHLPEDRKDEIERALAGAQLLIVAPTLGSEFRKALAHALSGRSEVGIPVLELLPVDAERFIRGENVLAWPCSPEKLRRAVASALLSRA
jgi:hypothetical protein